MYGGWPENDNGTIVLPPWRVSGMSGDSQLRHREPSCRWPPTDRRQPQIPTSRQSNGVQLIRSADDQCLRLVRVQLQSVLHVPLLDVSSTRGENGQPVGCVVGVYGETELRIICVLVVLYSVAGSDISQSWWHSTDINPHSFSTSPPTTLKRRTKLFCF